MNANGIDRVRVEVLAKQGGYFRTGDLAVKRADGRLKLVGRKKEMFKSVGYNVYPREVEIALESHPNVTSAAVVSIPDPRWQEIGVAFALREGAVTAEELDAWCRARLANDKAPKRYVIESSLPLLPPARSTNPRCSGSRQISKKWSESCPTLAEEPDRDWPPCQSSCSGFAGAQN
ncbi:MAG TPA: hypothetical protein VIU34_14220, partial [Steroidobacter sp.]